MRSREARSDHQWVEGRCGVAAEAIDKTIRIARMASRQPGVRRLEMFSDPNDPTSVHLVESWDTPEHVQRWIDSDDFVAYLAEVKPIVATIEFVPLGEPLVSDGDLLATPAAG